MRRETNFGKTTAERLLAMIVGHQKMLQVSDVIDNEPSDDVHLLNE